MYVLCHMLILSGSLKPGLGNPVSHTLLSFLMLPPLDKIKSIWSVWCALKFHRSFAWRAQRKLGAVYRNLFAGVSPQARWVSLETLFLHCLMLSCRIKASLQILASCQLSIA